MVVFHSLERVYFCYKVEYLEVGLYRRGLTFGTKPQVDISGTAVCGILQPQRLMLDEEVKWDMYLIKSHEIKFS